MKQFMGSIATRVAVLALAVAVLGTATAAQASQVLYGLSSSTPGTLYTIDTGTGAATAVTNLTGTDFTSLIGLAARGGLLYATDVIPTGAGNFSFGSIDPTTGAFTAINNQGGSANWHALAYVPGSDLFYTADLDAAGTPLLSVTPGGTISTIGNTNIDVRGLTYDSVNAILYAAANNALYTIDIGTAAATLVGSLGVSTGRPGLAYDNLNGVLYLNLGADDNSLYTVNVTSGLATLVGPNGSVAEAGIDGIAFLDAAVPEPTTIVSAGLAGLLLLGGFGLRRTSGRSRSA